MCKNGPEMGVSKGSGRIMMVKLTRNATWTEVLWLNWGMRAVGAAEASPLLLEHGELLGP